MTKTTFPLLSDKFDHGLFCSEKNIGIIIHTPELSFGHLGDAVSFEGFKDKKVDILAVPIVGIFTASPKGAIKELEKFKQPLPIIVPMHWLFRRPKSFCKKLKKRFPEVECIVPRDNTIISYKIKEESST